MNAPQTCPICHREAFYRDGTPIWPHHHYQPGTIVEALDQNTIRWRRARIRQDQPYYTSRGFIAWGAYVSWIPLAVDGASEGGWHSERTIREIDHAETERSAGSAGAEEANAPVAPGPDDQPKGRTSMSKKKSPKKTGANASNTVDKTAAGPNTIDPEKVKELKAQNRAEKRAKKAREIEADHAGTDADIQDRVRLIHGGADADGLCTFAFRLPKADSELIHQAAGRAKASKWARAILVAAAKPDVELVKAIIENGLEAASVDAQA